MPSCEHFQHLAENPELVPVDELQAFTVHINACGSCRSRLRQAVILQDRLDKQGRQNWRHLTKQEITGLQRLGFAPDSRKSDNDLEWHATVCPQCRERLLRLDFGKDTSFLTRRPAIVIGALAAILVLAVVTAVWLKTTSQENHLKAAGRTEYKGNTRVIAEVGPPARDGTPNRPPQPTTASQKDRGQRKSLPIFAFALVPSRVTRSPGASEVSSVTTVRIPPGHQIHLELGLGDGEALEYEHYSVRVTKIDGTAVWRESGRLRGAVVTNMPRAIVVTIRPGVLRQGVYVVRLSGVAPPTDIGYSFRVQ